jgi:hypothetical protein
MLLEEGMVDQLLDRCTVIGILLQALIEEIPNLCWDKEIGGNFNLILNYLNQLLFSCNLEGIFTYDHFVHHDSNRPDIDLLVVFSPLEDLRTNVKGRPAEGSPQFVVLMYRPPKITQLDDILKLSLQLHRARQYSQVWYPGGWSSKNVSHSQNHRPVSWWMQSSPRTAVAISWVDDTTVPRFLPPV